MAERWTGDERGRGVGDAHHVAEGADHLLEAMRRSGWVAEDRLVHYKLHAEIDERHADEFFAVIEPQWDNPDRRYFIEQGLGLGAYVFDRLYWDLYALSKEDEKNLGRRVGA